MSQGAFRFSFLASFIVLCARPNSAQVLFVDDSAPSGGDGSGWGLALNDLAAALSGAAAPAVEQEWVAEGLRRSWWRAVRSRLQLRSLPLLRPCTFARARIRKRDTAITARATQLEKSSYPEWRQSAGIPPPGSSLE